MQPQNKLKEAPKKILEMLWAIPVVARPILRPKPKDLAVSIAFPK